MGEGWALRFQKFKPFPTWLYVSASGLCRVCLPVVMLPAMMAVNKWVSANTVAGRVSINRTRERSPSQQDSALALAHTESLIPGSSFRTIYTQYSFEKEVSW